MDCEMDFDARDILSFFFFSSRRRHTRFDCDWSSDVCSSDLGVGTPVIIGTQNLNYDITDAKDDLIIHTGENNPASGDPTKVNPRVDDTEHTDRKSVV